METKTTSGFFVSMIFIILFIFNAGGVYSQEQKIDTIMNHYKDPAYLKYQAKRNMGIGLIAGGAILTGTGVAIFVSATHETVTWDHTSPIGKFIAGVLISVVGVAGLVSGTVTTAVNSSRMTEYKKKPGGLSFDIKCTLEQQGISLVYRF